MPLPLILAGIGAAAHAVAIGAAVKAVKSRGFCYYIQNRQECYLKDMEEKHFLFIKWYKAVWVSDTDDAEAWKTYEDALDEVRPYKLKNVNIVKIT